MFEKNVKRLVLLGLAASFAAFGCQVEGEEGSVELPDSAAAAYATPVDVETVRVYVDDTNHLTVTDDVPWVYGLFDLVAGAKVKIKLATENGTTGGYGFKVYKVSSAGQLIYLGSFNKSVNLTTWFGGSFVVEAVANNHPGYLALDITCKSASGVCTPLLQPGDSCGSRGMKPCDDGLYCFWEIEDQCGATDVPGVCERKPDSCPTYFMCPFVVGCDGNTYCSGCHAAMEGVSIACNPRQWNKAVELPAIEKFHQVWLWSGTRGIYQIEARLALGSDGTFRYEQDWVPTCTFTPPYCKLPNRYFEMTGTYDVTLEGGVQLYPSQEAPAELAQNFAFEVNCNDDVRLKTVELETEEVFIAGGACDATVFEKPAQDLAMDQVTGAWYWNGERNGHFVNAGLNLDLNGTFTLDEAISPLCVNATPPCSAPAILHHTQGTWTTWYTGLQLTPEVSDPMLAEAFDARLNCIGDALLQTTEEGLDETWTRGE